LPETIACISLSEVLAVKSKLARFTVAVSLLATMAMTLGAGLKWH
jgi:hypothetical protein